MTNDNHGVAVKRGFKTHRRSRRKFPTPESAREHIVFKLDRPLDEGTTTAHDSYFFVFREPYPRNQ